MTNTVDERRRGRDEGPKGATEANAAADCAEPGPFSKLVEEEWRNLCEKDDRTSPAEYPDMCLITHLELSWSMAEAWMAAEASAASLLRSQAERIGELERGLEPFAAIARVADAGTGRGDDDRVQDADVVALIFEDGHDFGDLPFEPFRRARALLDKERGEPRA